MTAEQLDFKYAHAYRNTYPYPEVIRVLITGGYEQCMEKEKSFVSMNMHEIIVFYYVTSESDLHSHTGLIADFILKTDDCSFDLWMECIKLYGRKASEPVK